MHITRNALKAVYLCSSLCIIILLFSVVHGQGSPETTLTLAVPGFDKALYAQALIDDFENANPGLNVQLVSSEPLVPDAADNLNKHFSQLKNYALSADVLTINQGEFPLLVDG